MNPSDNDTHREILQLHRQLDLDWRHYGESAFVSGWDTAHPYGARILQEVASSEKPARLDQYTILSESKNVSSLIQEFHHRSDGIVYDTEGIYSTTGSSPLLFAFFLMIKERGIDVVYYVPPIYYSCLYFAENLGITLRPVCHESLITEEPRLSLPDEASVLILCDPIWVMGIPVNERQFETLAQWQRRTGSTVFVDGTFQYTKWDFNNRVEQSSQLAPDLTFRLICPTKSLAVHGIRFAYMLFPPHLRESVRYPCANITGSTSSLSEPHAMQVMKALVSDERNRPLVEYIKSRYDLLRELGFILESAVEPSCSYYCFSRLPNDIIETTLTMDQRFFGLHGWENFVRVNLLAPYWEESIRSSMPITCASS